MYTYFVPNRLFWVLLVVLIMVLVAVPVLAQDATPEPTAEPPIVVDNPPAPTAPVFEAPAFGDAVQALEAALVAILATAIASPITAPLVSLVKRLPFLATVPGNVINLGVAIVLSAVMWLGQAFGLAGQVDTAFKLLFVLLPFISGIGSNFVSNQAVFKAGVKQNVPVLSYQRTKSVG